MAHLWVRDDDKTWAIVALAADVSTIVPETPHVVRRLPDSGEVALTRAMPEYDAGEADTQWVLLLAETTVARVNGSLVVGGIRALDDRDEIRGPTLPQCFLSTEQLAAVVPRPKEDAQASFNCPRCKLTIEPATPAVRCPVCAVWHHQDDTHPCWSYSDECAVCRHDTDLDRGYTWTPEEL